MTVDDQLAESRRAVLRKLRGAMSDSDTAGAQRSAARLAADLDGRLGDTVVFVAYGGGKDSSYTLAFVRAVQLILFERLGTTFTLRAATNRHAGMPRAVMENIDRAYRALGVPDDPACEPLLVDGEQIKPFAPDEPLPPQVGARNRLDLLMTGHRTFGEARPTFCNACNMSMVKAFGLAAGHGRAADVIVTGDSTTEQRAYLVWTRRLARRVANAAARPSAPDFGGFLDSADTVARAYFADLYGPDAEAQIAERRIARGGSANLRFFSIFEDTDYSAKQHWALLHDLLGFRFDEIAFSFTESDCGNPTLMAHLRGLKCERIYGRSYAEGLAEYASFAESLMERKEIPAVLIEMMRERYRGPRATDRMRAVANAFAHEAYGLGEEQLVCMVHSPFTDGGERLGEYLRREQPGLAGAEQAVRALLESAAPADTWEQDIASQLAKTSGLELRWMRTLYGSPSVRFPADGEGVGLIGAVLAGDPHKAVIATRHEPGGAPVRELVTGR